MTSAAPVMEMEIRESVRLFWNYDNGHEVDPNSFWYYYGTLSLMRVRRQDTLGLVPTKQCDPDECRSRPMTRQAGLTNQHIHLDQAAMKPFYKR